MMITVDAPARVNGEQLVTELAAAGLTVEVVLSGDRLEISGVDEPDRAAVEQVVAAHVPPEPPAPVPTLAELAEEIRGLRERAAAADTANATAQEVARAVAGPLS